MHNKIRCCMPRLCAKDSERGELLSEHGMSIETMIIGIDQSYKSTGVATLRDDGVLLDVRCIKGDDMSDETGICISRALSEIVSGCDAEDSSIAIEMHSVSSSYSTTARKLAELAGMIKYALRNYRVVEVPMSSWKSKIAKNRLRGINKTTKAGKTQYLDIVQELTGYAFGSTDEADGYMIAEYARRHML